MLLSWSFTMSTLQSPVVIFQSSSFDVPASFVTASHSLLSETVYLASGALVCPEFPPTSVATPFHSPLLNPLHLVLSPLEHLRDPPWTAFWILCSLNTLVALLVIITLNTIFVLITPVFLFFFYFLMFIFERESKHMSRGGAERAGDTESEAGSRLWLISTEPDAGLELANREIMTWAEVRRLTDWATQAPLTLPF